MGRISSEQYAIAESNGICRKTLHTRVYVNDWDVERSITQPIRRKVTSWDEWKDVSVVRRTAFYNRMTKEGMTAEEAATTPKRVKQGKIRPEDYAEAEKNGICRATMEQRVYAFRWPIEKAITRPLKPNGRRGKWDEVIKS